MTFISTTGRERLIKTHEKVDTSTFDDLLHSCAVTVEDAFITSGLVPNVDYKSMDVMSLAMRLALDWGKGRDVSITTGYPSGHPHEGLPKAHGLDDLKIQILKRVRDRTRASARSTTSTIAAWANKQANPPSKDILIDAINNLVDCGLLDSRNHTDLGSTGSGSFRINFLAVTQKGMEALS